MAALTRARRENPALRPVHYARLGEHTPGASEMYWFDQDGTEMSAEQWNDPKNRTLQYFAIAENGGSPNRVLLIVHGTESAIDVRLPAAPEVPGVTRYVSLWSSADERPKETQTEHAPGSIVPIAGTSMRRFRVE